MSTWTEQRDKIGAGIQSAAHVAGAWIASAWAGMSPSARSLAIGLAVGFALGAIGVGLLL